MDLRNTWQVAAGSILVPLGVVIVLLGWWGAAHAGYVQQQIPYVVSGGFLGLGALVVGALLYWAHWLYRIYDQADLHHRELIKTQEQILQALATPKGTAATIDQGSPAEGADFVATVAGTNFHLPNCPVVVRHPDGLRRVGEDRAAMSPCRICQPLGPVQH